MAQSVRFAHRQCPTSAINWSVMSWRCKTLAIRTGCLMFLLGTTVQAKEKEVSENPRVEVLLNNGNRIHASLLLEDPNQYFLNLGFTVLEIPRKEVQQMDILEQSADLTEQEDDNGFLYHTLLDKKTYPIQELVKNYSEAVVLVRTATGLGSGFVINDNGYVVTNDHVIAGEHEIEITVYKQSSGELTKKTYPKVKIIATSPEQDLALLKIKAPEQNKSFVSVPIGNSSELNSGQTVFAIGSPLGFERSVSRGIISVTNRLIEGRIYIQQTSDISPGNSGGPLLNLHGEVVGVNNMKVVVAGAEGLGFAVPANVLKVFLRNRDAFAFDPRNPNAGFRYNSPPTAPESDQ